MTLAPTGDHASVRRVEVVVVRCTGRNRAGNGRGELWTRFRHHNGSLAKRGDHACLPRFHRLLQLQSPGIVWLGDLKMQRTAQLRGVEAHVVVGRDGIRIQREDADLCNAAKRRGVVRNILQSRIVVVELAVSEHTCREDWCLYVAAGRREVF